MREFEPPTPPAAAGAIDVFFGDNLEVIQRFEQELRDRLLRVSGLGDRAR